MIPIKYIRSSSYNTWDYCQNQYFLEYVLGWKFPAGLKADLGTAVHKVLECLARIKLEIQNGSESGIITDPIGEISYHKNDIMKMKLLSDKEVDDVNKSRKNKNTYKWDCTIKYGHKVYGTELVHDIARKSFHYYIEKSEHNWENWHRKDFYNFVWIALDYCGGMFDPRKKDIIIPEKHFDIKIEKPWAKLRDGSYLHIKGTVDLTTKFSHDTIEVIDWKGLPIDTQIPTLTGWKTMYDLDIDDMIFDENGIPTKVIAKSNIKEKDCYKIYFDDKTSVISDDEHLWKISTGDIVSTKELCVGQKINITKPIITKKIDLPIDPYVLGVWLGDGRNKNGEISSKDEFIYNEIERRGYQIGDNINKTSSCPSRTVYGLTTQLRKLNLLNNKHIPDIYLRSSIEQRLDLLRGLMDTDGNANITRKQAVFTSCNKILSDCTKELLLTLGQRPNQSLIYRHIFNKNICIYPIHFRPININPFLLSRKADQINKNWGCGRSNRRRITNIEYIGQTKTQCIKVDSITSTYLCTKNMIPTHNTGQRLDWATGEVKDEEKLNKDPQLLLYYYALKQLYPEYNNILFTIFFIRDGGPYTVCFDDVSIEEIESMLHKRIQEIENTTEPTLLDSTHKDFRCNKICPFYKNKFQSDDDKNMCDKIHSVIKDKGIEIAMAYTKQEFDIGHYECPG